MAGSVNKVILELDALKRMYVEYRKSIPQIASALMATKSTVRKRLLDEGVTLRTRGEAIRLRSDHLARQRTGSRRNMTPEWRANIKAGRVAWGAENARGTSLKPNGYVEHTTGPDKGRGLHVTLMEKLIGRALRPDEVVHHVDENRSNNAALNLVLMTRAAHTSLHRKSRVASKGGI